MQKKSRVLLIAIFLVFCFLGCSTSGPYLAEKHVSTKTYDKAQKLYEKRKFAQAEELYRAFIEDNPSSPLWKVSMYYLGNCYQQTNRFDIALKTYEELVNRVEDDFWSNLAKERMQEVNDSLKK